MWRLKSGLPKAFNDRLGNGARVLVMGGKQRHHELQSKPMEEPQTDRAHISYWDLPGSHYQGFSWILAGEIQHFDLESHLIFLEIYKEAGLWTCLHVEVQRWKKWLHISLESAEFSSLLLFHLSVCLELIYCSPTIPSINLQNLFSFAESVAWEQISNVLPYCFFRRLMWTSRCRNACNPNCCFSSHWQDKDCLYFPAIFQLVDFRLPFLSRAWWLLQLIF